MELENGNNNNSMEKLLEGETKVDDPWSMRDMRLDEGSRGC